MKTNMRTAVIYARYSSDLQKDRSIDDQVALCRQIADRNGCKVVEVYADRAVSGAAMFDRPRLVAMMESAKKRAFDVVIVEAMSRLARNHVDAPAIYDRLKFNQIKIIDQSGEVTEVHVGVNSIVDSMFLKNLRTSVKRGMDGRAREGLLSGQLPYGYRLVPGKPGEREIDPEQARVVIWIFEQYAAGVSTRAICERLMADKVISPSKTLVWNHQRLLTGGPGLLANPIYIGKLIRNVNYTVKNPENGKRVCRKAPEKDRIEVDVPHLRIIDDRLWERVQAVRRARMAAQQRGPHVYKARDKERLVLGLLRCATCGGPMIVCRASFKGRGERVVCSNGNRRMGCAHSKSYDLALLESTVLDGVKDKLTDRKALLELTRAYHGRWQERQKAARSDRETVQKQLDRVTVKIDRIVSAIASEDGGSVDELMAALKPLRVEKAGLAERLKVIQAEGNVVDLHPKALDKFAATMEELHAALSGKLDAERVAPFRMAFRSVFERIVVHPTGKRMPYEVTPYARLGAIMGIDLFPKMASVEQMLAEQGVSASTISSRTASHLWQSCTMGGDNIIPLGRWQAAA